MRLALHHPNFSLPEGPSAIAAHLAATARAADEGGFAAMTVMDHWFQMIPLGGSAEPMLEGYTTLGYLAAVTERLELGTLVTGVTYRHPALLAKIVTTLDVLSGGRAFLGIGAAWYEQEHDAYGVPFPPLAERFERLEEALRLTRQMFGEDDGPFDGVHYHAGATINVPQPLHRLPVLIGGSGERKTLRLVARYADACNLFDAGPDEVRHKIEVLDEHCAAIGRDRSEIRITVTSDLGDDEDEFLARMRPYAALGVEQVWVRAPVTDAAARVTGWGERLVPRLAELGA